MDYPKICVNMIVKNESRIIQRCLHSLSNIIDYIVITDTGSTDNTKELIESYINESGKKGKVYEHEWKNFGYNRTNSINNAKEYLKEINEDLSKVYLLFVDADMKLVIRPSFNKQMLSLMQVGQIVQKNPTLEYYNTRICRADIPITCVGVTHEYYDTPPPFKNVKFEHIYIDDIGDGGAKADKFERDIKLLEQGLIDEPNNVRYFFYLAQSYNCIGKWDKSIEYYQKRIDSGGWHEEIYYSHLQIGNMYNNNLKDWDKAMRYYIDGYQKSEGKRGETLLKIVEHYKDKREYHTALIFLEKLFKVDYPKDHVLFIDYHVHTYKAFYEMSIISYYVNRLYDGLLAAQYMILSKDYDIPHHLRGNAMNNMVFYIKKLKTDSIKRIEDIMLLQHYNPSSSSFEFSKSNTDSSHIYEGIFRTVNYTINDKGQYLYPPNMNFIHTENFWVTLDGNKSIKQHRIIVSPEVQTEYKRVYYGIQGLEDGRHIFYNDKLYASFTSFEYARDPKASMVLAHIDHKDNYIIKKIVPLKYEENKIQKNWVPFEYQGKLCFVYSYEPFIILEVNPDNGECKEIVNKEFKYKFNEIRGSAPPIWIEKYNCYLILTHEVIFHDTRKYVHRILMLDSEFNLMKTSEPFYFENLFIEFTLSMMYDKNLDRLVIPYSYKDGEAFICTLDINNIAWLPDDIKSHFRFSTK